MKKIDFKIPELKELSKYPSSISYMGDLELLKRKKISIIGTRRPSAYTKEMIFALSSRLSNNGVVVVSGGAMGVDAVAHNGAKSHNTISVSPCGLNYFCPATNKKLLEDISKKGLIISQFDDDFKARPWSYVVRNELVVALGDILIVGEADEGSGSLTSVNYAVEMGKEIYVLPHRVGESLGTQKLILQGLAKQIYDLDEFVQKISAKRYINRDIDPFLYYCQSNPTLEEAIGIYGDEVYEHELEGLIKIENLKISVV